MKRRSATGSTPADEAARYAMVERAMRLKLGVVDRDPFESGERRTLNLGHTRARSGDREPLPAAARPGGRARPAGGDRHRRRSRRRAGPRGRIDDLLRRLGYRLTRSFDRSAVRDAIGSDKKRVRGRQRWILPMAIGSVVDVDDVTESELDLALDRITPFARGRPGVMRSCCSTGRTWVGWGCASRRSMARRRSPRWSTPLANGRLPVA